MLRLPWGLEEGWYSILAQRQDVLVGSSLYLAIALTCIASHTAWLSLSRPLGAILFIPRYDHHVQ